MTRHWYASFDPLLEPAQADAMVGLCARFGSYEMYCEAERRTWSAHADDLSVEFAVDRLVDDLRARGTLTGARPGDAALVDLIIDEYISFPRAVPADSRA